MKQLLMSGLVMLALAGCANDPRPSAQMHLSTQTIEQARAVGADQQVEEMRLAENKLARAEKNMAEKDYKRARVLAEQAELDARLAEARVLNQKKRRQLDELAAQNAHLRQQLRELH